ncbi:orotidine-5'-phosphate decarboxylase [Candidatus Woesearchaeota archaeon]|nr:orotidine-5'-phosphate decarboxylase [Candidatus Woesearchaeota archaeon]
MYLEKLVSSAQATQSIICFCIDPQPEHIPLRGMKEHRITEYYVQLFAEMDKRRCYPAALKFNEAYFLAEDDPFTTRHGSNALTTLVLSARQHPVLSKLPMIMDCKRCDIGKSARKYAKYYFENWGMDAITVSPYTGEDGLAPFMEYSPKKGIYALAKTSTSASIQEMALDEMNTVSTWMCQWISAGQTLGAVVSGRTAHDLGRHLHHLAPHVPLLIPGIGSQGGNEAESASLLARAQHPLYHRIAIGSSIAYAWAGKNDPAHFAEDAITALHDATAKVRGEFHGII